jgi:hypothetical protein
MTKEERFILVAYEELLRLGDEEALLDRYAIGQRVGMKERGVNASFKLFVRANFVRNRGDGQFQLTENGIALAKRLGNF